VIDQLRASTHQRLTRADYGQVSLGVFAAVFERVKQFGIDTCQAGKALGIYLVSLLLALA
jgi:hypothetical protein